MKKNLTEIVSENLLIVFFLLMILPFLILFFFNHPSADDWGLSQNPKIQGFFQTQIHYYTGWTGKYFSNLVLSFNPLYFNSLYGYKILTLLLMILFIYILFTFISKVTVNNLKTKEKFLITLAILFIYLYSMPSIAQSFYWLTASVVYQFGIMLIMIFLILYMRINKEKDSTYKLFLTIISILILIAIAGCSEMSMVTGILMISLLNIFDFLRNKKIKAMLILFTLISAIASYILISAPGNRVRGSLYPNSHQLILSLKITSTTITEYLFYWILYSPLLFVTLLIIPILYKIVISFRNTPLSFSINPLYTFLIYIIFLFILFFAPVWSLGLTPFNRTVNIIYFVFLIGWFYNIIVLLFYFSKKFNFNTGKIPGYVYTIALIIVVIFLFKKNNVRMAYADLLRGGAIAYNKELNERYDYIFKNPNDSLVVPSLKNLPRTIYFIDITDDPTTEFNIMYAHYFNKRYITVAKTDTLIKE